RRRRPELSTARAEPGARGGRGLARRSDARAPERRDRRAHPGLQHGLHQGGAARDPRLRAHLLRRGRRRRLLLAPAEPRASHRFRRRGHGLALPPQYREGLPEAADGVREGGSAALLQASLPLQSPRPVALAGAHLRRADQRRAVPPAGDLLRRLRPWALPVALRGAVLAAELPAVHARVERHWHPAPPRPPPVPPPPPAPGHPPRD